MLYLKGTCGQIENVKVKIMVFIQTDSLFFFLCTPKVLWDPKLKCRVPIKCGMTQRHHPKMLKPKCRSNVTRALPVHFTYTGDCMNFLRGNCVYKSWHSQRFSYHESSISQNINLYPHFIRHC